MKKITVVLTGMAVALLTGCSADIVGLDGGSYSPDALLVHDQNGNWITPLLILLLIGVFVVAARLKGILAELRKMRTGVTAQDSIEFASDRDKSAIATWMQQNPGKTINDYYQQKK